MAFGLALLFAGAQILAQQPQGVAGPNVNMSGGVGKLNADGTIEGDPFGQRANELSCDIDSRNPKIIFCGSNNYSPVAIAGALGDGATGDAWLGRHWSTDGGQTWRSDLLHGYPQDQSSKGVNSILHGFDAAADPTVKAWGGLFYYGGIAFNRDAIPSNSSSAGGEGKTGVYFVARFVNSNNRENDPDPVKQDLVSIWDLGNDGKFQDKPWMITSLPFKDKNGVPCTVGGGSSGVPVQTIPAHEVHVAYATFVGGNNKSMVLYQRSVDCGATSTRTKLSEGEGTSNGVTMTVHPTAGWVDIAWRRRRNANGTETDAFMFVRCQNGVCTKPMVVASLPLMQRADLSTLNQTFDLGGNKYQARYISNPTIVADANNRVYMAWSQRVRKVQNGIVTRDATIMLTVGTSTKLGAITWSTPRPIDELISPRVQPLPRGHLFRPVLAFDAGKLVLSFMHAQEDHTIGVFNRVDRPDPGNPNGPDGIPNTPDDGKIVTYEETREPKGDLAPPTPSPAKVFTEALIDLAPAPTTADVQPNYNNNPPLKRRHTVDIMALLGLPGNPPTFTSARVSNYGIISRNERLESGTPSVRNLPLFDNNNQAFDGDYDDSACRRVKPNATGTGFVYDIEASRSIACFIAWTDNRNVRPAPIPGLNYAGFNRAGPGCADPAQTGTRNQDPYGAQFNEGLYVGSWGNQKPLGFATLEGESFLMQRAYTVFARNYQNRTVHLRATIANQPIGGEATFLQFALGTNAVKTLDFSVAPFSSVSREVYVRSTNPDAQITVNVAEINALGGIEVAGGVRGYTILNPVANGPSLMPPLPDGSLDITDPTNAENFEPDVTSPDVTSANVDVTPDVTSVGETSPDVTSPDVTSVNPTTPDVTSPDVTSFDPTMPDVTSPDVTSPDVTSTPPSSALTDTTFKGKNNSNVAASFSVQTMLTQSPPAGFKMQLIVHQKNLISTTRGCDLKTENHAIVVASVPGLETLTPGVVNDFDPTNGSVKNVTYSVPPGGEVFFTYRLFDPNRSDNDNFCDSVSGRCFSIDPTFNPAIDVIPVVQAQAVDTEDVLENEGCTEGCPTGDVAIPLSVTTTALPNGTVAKAYSATLQGFGGTPPYTWSITGTLPDLLTLNSGTGQISGTPIVAGVFSFTLQVTDSSSPTRQTSRKLSITIPQTTVLYGVNAADDGLSVIDPTTNPSNATFIARLDPDTGLRTTPIAMAIRASDQTMFVWNNSNASPAIDGGELLTVDKCTGLAAEVNPAAAPQAGLGALAYNGTELFGADTDLYRINASTGVANVSGPPLGMVVGGMDFNSSGVLYGVELNLTSQRLVIIDTSFFNPVPPTVVATLSQNIGVVGSIVFSPSGTLIGSGFGGPLGDILFDINPANGLVSNVRPLSGGFPPQGMGFVLACPGALTITTTSLTGGDQGFFYSERLQAGLGTGGRTWSVTAGALPPGLSLDPSTGRISGTPTGFGTFNFTVTIQDSASQSDSQDLSIVINPPIG